jgi:hypothetical protein
MIMQLRHVNVIGNTHLVQLLADGDRPALDIYVSANTGAIRVGRVGAPLDDVQSTLGVTHIQNVITDDGVTQVPCLRCIVSYVGPRVVTLMTRVYVPKPTALLDVDVNLDLTT